MHLPTLFLLGAAVIVSLSAAPRKLVDFRVEGVPGVLAEQGVPVRPLSLAEAQRLVVLSPDGKPARAAVEPDGTDPLGRVRWVRVGVVPDSPSSQLTLAISDTPLPLPKGVQVERTADSILIRTGDTSARFTGKNRVELRHKGVLLLDGAVTFQLYPDARSIINAGGKTTVLAPFEPGGFQVEQPSANRVLVLLRGRNPKQKSYNFQPGNNEEKLGFDIEARFQFHALTPAIQIDWRLTNRAGYKSWLERCAMLLPGGSALRDSARRGGGLLGDWADFESNDGRFGITAGFAADFGPGFGMMLTREGLLWGGPDLPPDSGFGGRTPGIHRQFHHGMSRTFSGWLVPGASARSMAAPGHLIFPAQYYSDLGILPERGLRVQAGEFATNVERSSQWLLENQWRGTLWAGEWWREWDLGRGQGSEEGSNGNSVLAPLYHYLRNGDARFRHCAELSAWYTWDVQHDRKLTGFGPMLHTRRHLLDELDWIHPRYQRMMGPLLASHVFLASRERAELIETLRHFVQQIQAADGIPYNWDETKNKRAASETGVDTANLIEALIAAWEETGDPFFLDRARGYARWTVQKWRTRTDDTSWNWNLTRYVLTGMAAIVRVGQEYPGRVPEYEDFMKSALEIERHTITHPELTSVPGTIGGGDLHYVFYHAWLGVELARLSGDSSLLPRLAGVVRREVARQEPDGTFPMELGSLWSQYPTRVISYYDAKSVVAYLPVLGSRLIR